MQWHSSCFIILIVGYYQYDYVQLFLHDFLLFGPSNHDHFQLFFVGFNKLHEAPNNFTHELHEAPNNFTHKLHETPNNLTYVNQLQDNNDKASDNFTHVNQLQNNNNKASYNLPHINQNNRITLYIDLHRFPNANM